MLEIINLNKSYGRKKVLENINLNFTPGKIYGIVGENGAGKTTLFRCVAGLEDFDGIIRSPYKILKNHLGFLETNPPNQSLLLAQLLRPTRQQVYPDSDLTVVRSPTDIPAAHLLVAPKQHWS